MNCRRKSNTIWGKQMVTIVLASLMVFLVSCSTSLVSSDGHYKAVKVHNDTGVHYKVINTETGQLILTTQAQYDTPNDVKAAVFSPDSKEFAVAYHYGHEGTYTWIGVWSTETGTFLYSIRKKGWVREITDAFTTFPTKDFMKGVVYTSWQQGEYSNIRSDDTLSKVIKPMGTEWIAILVTCYQEKIDTTEIECGSNTPTEADLTHVIQYAHNLGLHIMLKPHIDLSNDPDHWRGEISFGNNETNWKLWFDNYTEFITHYASLAQRENVEYFVVGTELKGTSDRSDQWREVISNVRTIYSGSMTYAANWDEYRGIAWWDTLDAIGVDAYFPLTNSNDPTRDNLRIAWQPIIAELGSEAGKWNRPIIFTEIGYRSIDGANRIPSEYQTSSKIDLQEQADCYQAVFDTLSEQNWWRGVFWWNWTTDPDQGGTANDDYTAHNKPAENVLRSQYSTSSQTK